MGVGIAHPLDDAYLTNQPTEERAFVANKYGSKKDKGYNATTKEKDLPYGYMATCRSPLAPSDHSAREPREGHGRRKADTKDADETGEARSTAPRAGRRGGR